MPLQLATFGGGCFWCTEAIFKRLKGVIQVTPGYAGGKTVSPTYQDLHSGQTGHAEVIQVEFDPSQIPYTSLLDVFFGTHDPTTFDRQGNDVGEEYRSIIFFHGAAQKQQAEEFIKRLTASKTFPATIVTQVMPCKKFYPAEEMHQNFYEKNQNQPYCQFIISPKVSKLHQHFQQYLKES